MIPIRARTDTPITCVGDILNIQPNHPLADLLCPVCDESVDMRPAILVLVGFPPHVREEGKSWGAGGTVIVHADCAGAATSDGTVSFSFPPSNEALDAAYRERAQLVALLAAHYPSSIGATDPETPDWVVVTVELPTGQACWHIAPGDRELFGHVPAATAKSRPWDRHTTEEKYRRIRQQTAYIATVTSGADGIEADAGRPERAK